MNVDIINRMGRKRFDDAIKSTIQEYAQLEERVKSLSKECDELKTKLNDRFAVDKEIARLNEIIDNQDERLHCGFNISKQEYKAITEWAKQHNLTKHGSEYVYRGAIGGGLTYIFAPTGIGMVGKVKCSCGEEFCFQEI